MSSHVGMSSLQTHKIVVEEGGKKKRVPRDFGNPHDIVQLAVTHEIIRKKHGRKKFKNWIIKQSPWYKKQVPAKNG